MEKAMAKYEWAIPIHDAALISPAAALDIRKWYAQALKSIHTNRKSILQNYFKSIGITGESSDKWEAVKSKVVPLEEELEVSLMALK